MIHATITELNNELETFGEVSSLDPSDHGYRSHVRIRTREPIKGERFLRSGQIPLSGQSRNHRENVLEEGVSCYRVLSNKLVGYSPFSPGFESSANLYWITGFVIQIDLYGEGDWSDLCGSDGEPLIYNATYVSRCHKSPSELISS